jgi:nitroreductase
MNEVLENIYERRSVRSYSEESVPEDMLREIITAGFHAPNGHNEQGLRFAVVTNRAKLKMCSDMGKAMSLSFFEKANAEKPSEALAGMIRSLSNTHFDILYGAPALILVFASPKCLTPTEDGSLAAENMMLAARTFGLGSCWIGFAKPLGFSPELMKEFNVPMDHQLIAPLIFGYPKKTDMRPATREEPPILGWLR